jgi:hypothetical protein
MIDASHDGDDSTVRRNRCAVSPGARSPSRRAVEFILSP